MTLHGPSVDLAPHFGESTMFSGVSPETVHLIFKPAIRLRFEAGEIVFFQDDLGDALYMVEDGSIEISVMTSEGKKLSLNIMESKDVFGEIAVLDGGPRTATATALEPSSLLTVKQQDVVKLMRENSTVANDLIVMLCGRLRWTSQLVEDFGLLGIQGRMANRLSILHRKHADNNGVLHISQNELADFLGATRESTNKFLQNWRQQGIIALSRGTLQILDHGRLSHLASSIK